MKIDVRTDSLPKYGTVILLNGETVPACVMADDEAGVIERWETDAQGRVKVFYVNGEPEPHLIREYGSVQIELPK